MNISVMDTTVPRGMLQVVTFIFMFQPDAFRPPLLRGMVVNSDGAVPGEFPFTADKVAVAIHVWGALRHRVDSSASWALHFHS